MPQVLGKLIAHVRKRAEATQVDLADAACVSQSKMSRVEAGAAPNVFELTRIAARLGTTPEALLRETRRVVAHVDTIVEQVTGHEADWNTNAAAYDGLITFVLENIRKPKGTSP